MKKILERMKTAVGLKRGVRLTRAETKKIVNSFDGAVLVYEDKLRSLKEKADMADCYLDMRRCKSCESWKLNGYVCPCGVDDTEISA